MATKSKSSRVEAYFFYFPLLFLNTGLLSTHAKHKNDYHSIFFRDIPSFLSIPIDVRLFLWRFIGTTGQNVNSKRVSNKQ